MLYRKNSDPMVISPDDPEDFVNMLKAMYGIENTINEVTNEELVRIKIPSSKSERIMEYIGGVPAAITIGFIYYYWCKLPNVIVTHFDKMENPNHWSDKSHVLFGSAIILMVIYIAFGIADYFLTHKKVFVSCANEVLNTPNLTRLIVKTGKLFMLSVNGYFTWQTGLMALGIIKHRGTGLPTFIMAAAFTLTFFFITMKGIRSSRQNYLAERDTDG